MEPYTVVWSGEIEKRVHDQQIRPAPPIESTSAQHKAYVAKLEDIRRLVACCELVRGPAMKALSRVVVKCS